MYFLLYKLFERKVFKPLTFPFFMDNLVPLMEDEWEAMCEQEFGNAYPDLKHIFDEKIGNGFEGAKVNPKKDQKKYLVRIAIRHIGYIDIPEVAEFDLNVREIDDYDVCERARIWEIAGEYVLWFGAMSKSDDFINQGMDSFLGASDMLKKSGKRFKKRYSLDWDVGLDFQDLTEVLRESDLLSHEDKLSYEDHLFMKLCKNAEL